MTLSKVQAEAFGLAREVQGLASACSGLTAALDKGWPTAGDDQTLSALRVQWGAASRQFDELVASVSVAYRAEWTAYVRAISSALLVLGGLASERQRAAGHLVSAWELAAAGRTPPDFAGPFLEGVLLVDQNYRLLRKAGVLPPGFPRVPRVG
jgi:hypothetical protein